MPSNGRRPGPAARRHKASRRDARSARQQHAAGELSRHDQRRLRAMARARELVSRRRHREFRHLAIVALSGIAAVAVTGVALGLVPAVEAARGNGTIGTFVVGYSSCYRRADCTWVGTFEAPGDVVPGVVYEGSLPAATGPGSRVPARYPGDDQAYAVRGSHAWAWDLLPMLLIGSAVAFLLWLSPVGLREHDATSAV